MLQKVIINIAVLCCAHAIQTSDQHPLFKSSLKDKAEVLNQQLDAQKVLHKKSEQKTQEIQKMIEEERRVLYDLRRKRYDALNALGWTNKRLQDIDFLLESERKKIKQSSELIKRRESRESKTDPDPIIFNMMLNREKLIQSRKELKSEKTQKLIDKEVQLQSVNMIVAQELEHKNKVANLNKELPLLEQVTTEQKKVESTLARQAREAIKASELEQYRISKAYPDLVKLYESKQEVGVAQRSWWQQLTQTPRNWLREYAQRIRKKELKAVQKGEALSKRRFHHAPTFTPRLTQKEQERRRAELGERKGKADIFEADQTANLHPDKNIGAKALNELRTWYARWRVPSLKTPSNNGKQMHFQGNL